MKSLRPYPNFTIDDAEEIVTAALLTSAALAAIGLPSTIFGHPHHPWLMWTGILLLIPITLFLIWAASLIFIYGIIYGLYGNAIDNWKEIKQKRAKHLQTSTPHSMIRMIEKERRP